MVDRMMQDTPTYHHMRRNLNSLLRLSDIPAIRVIQLAPTTLIIVTRTTCLVRSLAACATIHTLRVLLEQGKHLVDVEGQDAAGCRTATTHFSAAVTWHSTAVVLEALFEGAETGTISFFPTTLGVFCRWGFSGSLGLCCPGCHIRFGVLLLLSCLAQTDHPDFLLFPNSLSENISFPSRQHSRSPCISLLFLGTKLGFRRSTVLLLSEDDLCFLSG